jgi:hypothetical protein
VVRLGAAVEFKPKPSVKARESQTELSEWSKFADPANQAAEDFHYEETSRLMLSRLFAPSLRTPHHHECIFGLHG